MPVQWKKEKQAPILGTKFAVNLWGGSKGRFPTNFHLPVLSIYMLFAEDIQSVFDSKIYRDAMQ